MNKVAFYTLGCGEVNLNMATFNSLVILVKSLV